MTTWMDEMAEPMLNPATLTPVARALALGALVFSLSACDVRRDGAEGDPQGDPTPEATEAMGRMTPEPTPSETETGSIIREDLAPPEVDDEPVEPLELVIPMPEGSEISASAERLLVSALSSDAMDESWPIVLGGHTDSVGNDQANLRSSRARAEAVAAWLVEYGVDDDRIEVIAFGEQNPVAPNAREDGEPNEAGRRRNRRVELRIAPPEPESAATSRPTTRSNSRSTSRAE